MTGVTKIKNKDRLHLIFIVYLQFESQSDFVIASELFFEVQIPCLLLNILAIQFRLMAKDAYMNAYSLAFVVTMTLAMFRGK